MKQQNEKWHQCTVQAVEEKLHTNASCGLSCKEARSRYRKNGPNRLFDTKIQENAYFFKRLLGDPAVLLLLFSCLLAFFFAEVAAGIAALVCLLIAACYLARIFFSVKKHETDLSYYRIPTVTVIRDGKAFTTSARNVVRGDLLLLGKGDIVPCDCRLVSADGVAVRVLHPNEEGKAVYSCMRKSACVIDADTETVFAPFAENMLYGGSELDEGQALAIAVEVGEYSFLGAMEHFVLPSERSAKQSVSPRDVMMPYIKLYSFFLFVLLLPLVLIGFLTSSEKIGIVSIFLLVASLVGGASGIFLSVHFSLPAIRIKAASILKHHSQDRVVYKSVRSLVEFAQLSDLFVMGSSGITDGKQHLSLCATGKGILPLDSDTEESTALSPVCEAFWILQRAEVSLPNRDFSVEDRLSVMRDELTDFTRYDKVALSMRLERVALVPTKNSKIKMLDVKLKNETFQLLFSEGLYLLDRCTYFDDFGRMHFLDPNARQELENKILSICKKSDRILTLIRRTGDTLCLLGVVGFSEKIQTCLPSVVEEMKQSGVRVSFFLSDDPYHHAMVQDAHITGSCLSKRTDPSADLIEYYDQCRVFYGFSEKEIFHLIQDLKKRRHRVAVMGVSHSDWLPMQASSLSIACDSVLYHEKPLREHLLDRFATDGVEHSERVSQSVRRHADALVSRANREGGGLYSVLRAITDCRAIGYRSYMLLHFLVTLQIPTLVMTLIPLCFGVGAMRGDQLLYGSLLTGIVGCVSLVTLPIPQPHLRKTVRFSQKGIEARLLSRALWLPPLLGAVLPTLLLIVLRFFDAVSDASLSSYLFVSMLLLHTASLCLTVKCADLRPKFRQILLPISVLWGPVLLVMTLSVIFPAINNMFPIDGWSLLSLLLLPLSLILYVGVYFALSKK